MPVCAEKIGYNLNFSESELVLDNPGDAMAAMVAAWQMHPILVNARSMPFFDLTNISDTSDLSVFRLELGDTAFKLESVTEVNYGGVGVVVNMVGGDVVELDFTNFTPGTTIRFKIQIRPDDAMAFQNPDYRLGPLFDINGADPTDNATVAVSFDAPPPFGTQTLSAQLPDYASGGPVIGPFDVAKMDHVDLFNLMQMEQLVPEPSSAMLFLMGLLPTAAYLRRRRPRC